MKAISLAILLAVPILCSATDDQPGREWLRPPPENKSAGDWIPLAATDVFEVVASKEIVAILRDLPDKPFAPLTDDQARYFTGTYYRKESGKKTFLIRAVYGQGGTGRYTVSHRGNDILVDHGSLGHQSAFHKSALIVNLDFEPHELYLVAEIAE